MNDSMQEEFEAWSARHDYLGGCKLQTLDGRYRDIDLQHAWESWRASRELLTIELPKVYENDYGFNYFYRDDIEEAAKSAGIKTK